MCNKKTRKLKSFKIFIEATQLENKMNHIEKNEIGIDSIKKVITIKKSISK